MYENESERVEMVWSKKGLRRFDLTSMTNTINKYTCSIGLLNYLAKYDQKYYDSWKGEPPKTFERIRNRLIVACVLVRFKFFIPLNG